MTTDKYALPEVITSNFLFEKETFSGEKWHEECLSLATRILSQSAQVWLLYEEDFYQFSIMFFALLLAKKDIVLAQNGQEFRLDEAGKQAEISIGSFANSNIKQFNVNQDEDTLGKTLIDGTINPNSVITFFTSGSSGNAKPVKKYWYQLINEFYELSRQWPNSGDTVVATVTHKHVYGLLFKLVLPIYSGKNIVVATVEYTEQLHSCLVKFNDVSLISSPIFLTNIDVKYLDDQNKSIRTIFCSGGVLNSDTSNKFFHKHGLFITEVYGSTETGGIAWRVYPVNPQWRLFDEHQVTQTNESTLILRSPFLALGETYETDDRIKLTGRYFDLLGRKDRIIKLNEKRVSLDELEQHLSSLKNVSGCHSVMLDDKRKQLAIVVQLDSLLPDTIIEKKALVKDLKAHLLQKFEPSVLPKKWRFVQKLPYNSQGKLLFNNIKKLFL